MKEITFKESKALVLTAGDLRALEDMSARACAGTTKTRIAKIPILVLKGLFC